LIEELASGPEGGGSLTYDLIDFHKKKPEIFNISSNFSEGEGSEPQTISEEACRAALTKANEALSELGFDAKFKVESKTCRRDRDDLLKGKEKKDLSLDFEKVGQMGTQAGLPGRGASAVAFSKNGKNSIIVENNGKCDARCYRIKAGEKADTYRNDG